MDLAEFSLYITVPLMLVFFVLMLISALNKDKVKSGYKYKQYFYLFIIAFISFFYFPTTFRAWKMQDLYEIIIKVLISLVYVFLLIKLIKELLGLRKDKEKGASRVKALLLGFERIEDEGVYTYYLLIKLKDEAEEAEFGVDKELYYGLASRLNLNLTNQERTYEFYMAEPVPVTIRYYQGIDLLEEVEIDSSYLS